MPKLSIQKLAFLGYRGTEPVSGSATFSDGRTFHWCRIVASGEIVFETSRQIGGMQENFFFHSPKRAAAVSAVL